MCLLNQLPMDLVYRHVLHITPQNSKTHFLYNRYLDIVVLLNDNSIFHVHKQSTIYILYGVLFQI